jgi:hypothetical protein
MTPLVKVCALIAAGALAAMVLLSIAGYLIDAKQFVRSPQTLNQLGPYAGVTFFSLFLVMGFALVPLFLRLFVVLQERIGNGELGIVRMLRAHEAGITYGVWAMFLVGALIALPVMLKDLFGFRPAVGRSEGTLVANIGMALDEVRRVSTLKVPEIVSRYQLPNRQLIGEPVFDFEIAGTGMRFERCRYYWIETDGQEPAHIEEMNIGISPVTLSRAELAEAHRRVQQQLQRDGWSAGQINYKTPEQQALHSGMTSSGRGAFWLKGNTFLRLYGKRMDEPKGGEDPESAGEWIQYLQMGPPKGSRFSDVEFSPP